MRSKRAVRAAFLRLEAQAGGYEVLNTSTISLEEAVDHVCTLLRGQALGR
jgi:hypothetical protein